MSKSRRRRSGSSATKRTQRRRDKKIGRLINDTRTRKKKPPDKYPKLKEKYEKLKNKYDVLDAEHNNLKEIYTSLRETCSLYYISQEELKKKNGDDKTKHLSPRAREYYKQLASKINLGNPVPNQMTKRQETNSIHTVDAETKSHHSDNVNENQSTLLPAALVIDSPLSSDSRATEYDKDFLKSDSTNNSNESWMEDKNNSDEKRINKNKL